MRKKPGPKPRPAAARRTARVNLFFTPPDFVVIKKASKADGYGTPAEWLGALAMAASAGFRGQ